jgi:uncharacterized caspase-like protein
MKTTSRLNQTPRFHHEELQSARQITRENVGEHCFLRIERQGLARLPVTNAVLFTIHTYQAPLAQVVTTADYAQRMYKVVRTMPEEMHLYKAIAPFADVLLEYLASQT